MSRVCLEAMWIFSAVKKFAYTLSRTWDPCYVRATESFSRSVLEKYRLDRMAFLNRPLGETFVARRRYMETKLNEYWGWSRAFVKSSVRLVVGGAQDTDEVEGGSLALNCPAQVWFACLTSLSSRIRFLNADDSDGSPTMEGDRELIPRWQMVVA